MSLMNMFKDFQGVRGKLKEIKRELESILIESTSKGGEIFVSIDGKQSLKKIEIREESLLTIENKGKLERLLEVEVNRALIKSFALYKEKVEKLTGNLNI